MLPVKPYLHLQDIFVINTSALGNNKDILLLVGFNYTVT